MSHGEHLESDKTSWSHLLQVEHDGREGLLQNPQNLPALLQTEARQGGGARRSHAPFSAGLLHSRLHDPVASWRSRTLFTDTPVWVGSGLVQLVRSGPVGPVWSGLVLYVWSSTPGPAWSGPVGLVRSGPVWSGSDPPL